MQRRSIRRWCFRAVLLGTSLLIGVLLLELALRALGVSYAQFYQPDPICGAALKPDAEGWFLREGKAYIRINSAGLRDREHSLEKAPGTLRIAVLGDSYAEAFQVPVEETFWAVMEGELGSLLGPDGPRWKRSTSASSATAPARSFSRSATRPSGTPRTSSS